MQRQAQHEWIPPWKPWLRRFIQFSAILVLVVIVILAVSRITPIARNSRYSLSFVGIISLAGAALNGGMAVALWLDNRSRD